MSNIRTAVVFSKPSCPFCVKAKNLLKQKDIPITEHIVGQDASKADIQKMVDTLNVKVQIRTVPQIFFVEGDGATYVGGFDDLCEYFGE